VILPRLIGMVHLGPLPGSPGYRNDLDAVVDAAEADAVALADAGFEAVIVENYGDAPFFADDVPNATVAAMTRAVGAVSESTGLVTGVNILRNDASAALAIAAATGAGFIRANVLSGTMYTDQGPIVGRAAEIARLRRQLCPEVAIVADVFVKHATPPPGLTIENAARDLAERGGADAVVVSGTGTGRPLDLDELIRVRAAIDVPVLAGSGVTSETVAEILSIATGAIVGSATKVDGIAAAPVDPIRAASLIAAAGIEGTRAELP
jgi:membrane complex biogenesis BtpA family protein